MERIRGTVKRIRFQNKENGYTIAVCRSGGRNDFCAVGTIPDITVDSRFVATGSWEYNPKYGMQFKVSSWEEEIPNTIPAILSYLSSGMIHGIGPVCAHKIVDYFGSESLNVIEKNPDKLIEVPGIGEKRVEIIKSGYSEHKQVRNIIVLLQEYGISPAYANKIYRTFKEDSVHVMKKDPYRLADEVWGIGFKTADKIAMNLGIKKDSFIRLRSGIKYTLEALGDSGDCYADKDILAKKASELLEVEEGEVVITLDELLRAGSLISDENNVYLPQYYYAELGTARNLARVLSGVSQKDIDADRLISSMQQNSGIQYDELQIAAIRGALTNKVFYLTGGPGTGKTTTTNAIIECFKQAGCRVLLAAPTGRAAKRMSEVSGEEVLTIHRLLEFSPDGSFRRNDENRLEGDVLIVDECSMIDILLMNALMKAVPSNMTVIFVGDVNQLPSVGSGNVLSDIIVSDVIPGIKLNKIFRQAEGSRIITNAYKINSGKMPDLSNGKDTDFFFINTEDDTLTAKQIVSLSTQRLAKYYKADPTIDIQILAPMKKGLCGTVNLNRLFQEALNPDGIYLERGGTKFRINDKVMQLRNNYEKEVFNGDIGFIKEIDLENHTLKVDFDGSVVQYYESELDEITLAYAITVHKSQGSEHRIVVMPLLTSHYIMLNRNLLYTGVTRAKEVFVMMGSKKAVGMAVKNQNASLRCTSLDKQLKNTIGGAA